MSNILDAIRDSLDKFTVWANPNEDPHLAATWVAHTYLYRELRESPRLLLTANQYGSGKTNTANHVARLAWRGQRLLGSSLTMNQLRTFVGTDVIGTCVFDEMQDRLTDKGSPGRSDLVAIVKDGYKSGATMPVTTQSKGGGHQVELVDIFAPVAFVGNRLPDALSGEEQSRCLALTLRRSPEQVTEYDDDEHGEEVQALVEQIQAWADSVRGGARVEHGLPQQVTGRARELWRPLKRVALLSGSGTWAQIIDLLAADYVEQMQAIAEERTHQSSEAERLLLDVVRTCDGTEATVEDRQGRRWLKTDEAIERVCGGYSPWLLGDLTAHAFGGHLRSLGLKTGKFRDADGRSVRGWRWQDLLDLHASLTPSSQGSATSAASAQAPQGGPADGGEDEPEGQIFDVGEAPDFDQEDDLPDGTCAVCGQRTIRYRDDDGTIPTTHPTCNMVGGLRLVQDLGTESAASA